MDHAQGIWNRALDYDVDLTTPGDQHLRAVLTFDGSAESGGLTSAVETYLDDEEFSVDQILSGLEYFGLPTTAALVATARDRLAEAEDSELEEMELSLDPQYPVVGEDLSAALDAKLATHPEDFAPIR